MVRLLQFAAGSDVTDTVALMKSSGANVFLSFVDDVSHFNLLKEANRVGLFGKDYVWFGNDGSATRLSILNPVTGAFDTAAYNTMIGTLGTQLSGGTGESYRSESKSSLAASSK